MDREGRQLMEESLCHEREKNKIICKMELLGSRAIKEAENT